MNILEIQLKIFENEKTLLADEYSKPQRYFTDKDMLNTKISENINKIYLQKKYIKILSKRKDFKEEIVI